MVEGDQYKRQTAIKIAIDELLAGMYIEKEGWTPNFVRTCRGEVSRVNIVGSIIMETSPGAFLLDDGTGQITLRTFDALAKVSVGDVVCVIGRPRAFNKQLFVNYETIKTVKKEWLAFRKKELSFLPKQEVENTQETSNEGEEVVVKTSGQNLFNVILALIRDIDKANNSQGAAVEEILEKAQNQEAEHILNNLIEEGEVFEIKPGLIKVLE